MIKIAIADDDIILVNLFQDFFKKEQYIDCELIAYEIEDLFNKLKYNSKIDYLFLDIDFQGYSSIEHIPRIRKEYPNVEIIMFTQNIDDENIFKAIYAGATGFLPKAVSIPELKEHIKIILQGGAAITPQIAKKMIAHFQPKAVNITQKDGKSKKLSSKDLQILELLAGGYGYQSIAEKVGLTINGVRYHVKKIYKIMHISNRAEAAALFKDGIF